MKKNIIFAAFAAALSLASCQKEMDVENGPLTPVESPVFTAEISEGAKTTLNAADGKVSWESTDKITVTDNASKSAVYKVKSFVGGQATFVIEDGQPALGAGPYTATYGTAPETAQTYSETPGKFYMTAPATSNNRFTFTVQCGLLEFNLTKSGTSIKSVSITGTPAGGSKTTYTLKCSTAQSIEAKKSFYIAVPAGNYTKIVIKDSKNDCCILKSSGIDVATNHIKPLTFSTKLVFKAIIPAEFSVSSTKKVYLSKGNLWADDANNLHFEDAQWKITPSENGSADFNHLSHFTWSTDADGTLRSVDGSEAIYYNLTDEEMTYIFTYHPFKSAMVHEVPGLIVAPDDFQGGYEALLALPNEYANDEELATYNFLFTPYAGQRNGNAVTEVGTMGYYWTSTPSTATDSWRARMFPNAPITPPDHESILRNVGNALRLATNVQ